MRRVLLWVLWTALVLLLAACGSLSPENFRRPTGVLFADGHGWNGGDNGGCLASSMQEKYGELARQLRAHDREVTFATAPVDQALDPSEYGTLVISACITEPFSSEEKAAMRTFVQHGGLLLAFGEFDGLFNTDYVNQALEPLGLVFEATEVKDDENHYEDQNYWVKTRAIAPEFADGVRSLVFFGVGTVSGGTPIVTAMPTARIETASVLEDAPVLAAKTGYGRGTAIAVADTDFASSRFIGTEDDCPFALRLFGIEGACVP